VPSIEGEVTRVGASERSRGDASDIDGQNREAERSFWEKRHRRQSARVAAREQGTRTSFKWAGAHESTREPNEFQNAALPSIFEPDSRIATMVALLIPISHTSRAT
jgi:hypothetical protein